MRNLPKKHHYIPIFYLKSWRSGCDNRICQFSRPYGPFVKALRVSPKQTGFADNLYQIRGAEPEFSQQIETNLFGKIDSQAAQALKILQ